MQSILSDLNPFTLFRKSGLTRPELPPTLPGLGREERLKEKQERGIIKHMTAITKAVISLEGFLKKDFLSLPHCMELLERFDSARYALDNLEHVRAFSNKNPLLEYCIDLCNKDGLFTEFGVYRGETARTIAGKIGPERVLHGFDSFEGLPAGGGFHLGKGEFDAKGELPEVPSNVKLHVGWFDDTLPKFCAENQGPVSFIHVDCDIYPSTKAVFNHLGPRMVPGTIIAFDEFFNFKGWKGHEYKAFNELVAERKIEFKHIGWTGGRQVAVQILSIGNQNR